MKLIAGCLLLGSLTFAQNAPTAFQNVDGCGQTPQVPNGYIEDGPSDFGTRRMVRCNPGAIREGPWSIVCQENGVWTRAGSCRAGKITIPNIFIIFMFVFVLISSFTFPTPTTATPTTTNVPTI